MFKKLFSKPPTVQFPPAPDAQAQSIPTTSFTSTVTIPASTLSQNQLYSSIGAAVAGNMGNITAAVGAGGNGINPQFSVNTGVGTGVIGGGMFQQVVPTSIISFYKNNSQEIVKLKLDGSVEWANGIHIDEAAEAFSRSLSMGAEIRAGISKSVKLKMRDSVFEDLINIAKEKGSLSADDLTYLLEASKIVEKLKGGE